MFDFNTEVHPDQVVCRCCGQKRVKTFGTTTSNKRVIWVNEFGERWYGKKCPNCYKAYKESYDQKRRLELGHRPFGSFDNCSTCGNRFLVKVGATKKCPGCKSKNIKTQLKLSES